MNKPKNKGWETHCRVYRQMEFGHFVLLPGLGHVTIRSEENGQTMGDMSRNQMMNF